MEGCGYRDLQSEFDALGVVIVGASFDSPAANQAFAEAEGFLYELWTDGDRTLALTYGAASSASASFASRRTVLLDDNGDLLLEYNVGSAIATHPAQVLEDCELIFGSR